MHPEKIPTFKVDAALFHTLLFTSKSKLSIIYVSQKMNFRVAWQFKAVYFVSLGRLEGWCKRKIGLGTQLSQHHYESPKPQLNWNPCAILLHFEDFYSSLSFKNDAFWSGLVSPMGPKDSALSIAHTSSILYSEETRMSDMASSSDQTKSLLYSFRRSYGVGL